MERLEIFFRLSKRTGEALSIIFADIDHFKSINDRFGHLAGDKVLVAVSDLLRYQTRDSDLVGRYGGEEFLFVLYSCPPAEALQASERKRVVLEHLCISMPDSNCDIGLTMSFGVSCLRKDDTSVDAVIARADAALYEAKNAGRNRSVLRD